MDIQEQVLRDTQSRLRTEVPALKYVDEDWGQIDYYNPHPPVKWPIALIDIGSIAWSNTAGKQQMGLAQIKVRIADIKVTNTSGAAPASQRDQAFAIFTLLGDIHKALHGWAGQRNYSKLIRTNTQRIKRDDGVRVYELTYTTEVYDNSAVAEVQKVVITRPTITITN